MTTRFDYTHASGNARRNTSTGPGARVAMAATRPSAATRCSDLLLVAQLSCAAHEGGGGDRHHPQRDHARDEAREPEHGVGRESADIPSERRALVEPRRAEHDGEAALLAAREARPQPNRCHEVPDECHKHTALGTAVSRRGHSQHAGVKRTSSAKMMEP